MWVAFAMVGGCPWGQPQQCLGYELKEKFDKARPKTWQILATSSCEMPLNQQLQPVTVCKNITQKITANVALVGL